MLFTEKARKRRLRVATGVAYPRGYRVFRRTVWWITKPFAIFRVVGVDNIPAPDGVEKGLDYYPDQYLRNGRRAIDSHPYVIVPNHTSVLDVPALGALRRPKAIVGKAPFAMVVPFVWLFKRMGLVPIKRAKDDRSKLPGPLGRFMVKWRLSVTYRAQEMFDVCTAALDRGVPVEIYATGSRTDTATKLGPFILACRAGVPIIPVAISGCKKGDKTTRTRFLRRRLIVVNIGQPIMPPVSRVGEVPQEQLEAFRQVWDDMVYGELLPEADEIRRMWHSLGFSRA
jgi:1-acyl-sn-glycerol-3-phosphate acyltransferase